MSLLDNLKRRQEGSQPSKELAAPEATHDIERDLAVNPPPVAGEGVAAIERATEALAPSEGTPCPTCNKRFKQISRHRCKNASGAGAPEASGVTYPTDVMLDVILPTLNGPHLDAYVKQYGISRYNPGDDPGFRETIRHLITRDRDGVIEEPFVEPEPVQAPTPEPVVHVVPETKGNINVSPDVDVKQVKKQSTQSNSKDHAPHFDLIIGAEVVQAEGMGVVHFYDIAYLLEKQIKENIGMSWIEVEFGKGKAVLIECMEKAIKEGELNNKTIVVTTRSHTYAVVADLLRQYARNVIVGVQL